MEAMPRFPMIAPDLKIATAPFPEDFPLKIKEHILMHFQDEPNNYDNAIREITTMKQQIMHDAPDVAYTCLLKRYYAQMLMMKNRFPMEEGDILEIPFSWSDRLMDMPNVVAYEDIGFELACIMFNIGAVHANIAAKENRETEDSIKNAFMHFQQGAWPLQQVRDAMGAAKYSTMDFEKDVLTFYVNILLGQAQECLVEKSLIDGQNRSKVIVAKLAAHLRDLYRECSRHLEASALGDVISGYKYKEWIGTCGAKSEFYGAIAMLYMGMQADSDKKYGERLGYYQLALKHVMAGQQIIAKYKQENMKQSAEFLYDVVAAKEQNAKKENDFIYHEKVPNNDQLAIKEGYCKVKPLSFDPLDPSVSGEDVFGYLLPPTVLKAVSQYEEEKARVKRDVLERIAKKDHDLSEFISSLDVESMCLNGDGRPPLPDMLLERNAAFNAQPGAFPILLDKLHKICDFARETDIVLPELLSRMEEVDVPHLVNDDGFKAIKVELARLNDEHMKARQVNADLQQAMAAHSENLRILALPLYQLSERLGGPVNKPGETPEGATLKKMLDKATEMQEQRVMLVQRLNDQIQKDNVSKKLLTDRDLDNSTTFSRELEKHSETIGYIDQNLGAQDKILDALTDANADFAQYRKQLNDMAESRSSQIMALVAAYDIYSDVCLKADSVHSFYSSLQQRLQKLKLAVDDIHTAYMDEKKKREAEKKALEERLVSLRKTKEARDAMNDFGGPSQMDVVPQVCGALPNGKISDVGISGGRRDYMEFFRAKMGGGIPTTSPALTRGVPPQLPAGVPSPTPSPMNFIQNSRHNIPDANYNTPSQLSHGDMRPLSYSQTSTVHPQVTSQYGHRIDQFALPPPFQGPAIVPPLGYTNFQNPHLNSQPQLSHVKSRAMDSAYDISQMQSCNASALGVPTRPGSFVPTQPTSNNSQGYAQLLSPSQAIPTSNLSNNSSSHRSEVSSAHENYTSHYQQQVPPPLPVSSQVQAFPLNPSSNQHFSAFHPIQPAHTTAPPHPVAQPHPSYSTVGGTNQVVGNAPAISSPWHQGVASGLRAASSPWHSQVSAQPVLVGGTQPCGGNVQQPIGIHSNGTNVVPPVNPPQQYQPPFTINSAPNQNIPFVQGYPNQAPAPNQQSNVDLLGSLVGDLHLPPAMQPQTKLVDRTTNLAINNITNSIQSSISNECTKTIPISESVYGSIKSTPQISDTTKIPETNLNQPLSFTDLHSFCQTPLSSNKLATILPLSEVSDPSKFEIGPDDKLKLDKRLLHASFKNGTVRPELDKSDPLNHLDPFWKA